MSKRSSSDAAGGDGSSKKAKPSFILTGHMSKEPRLKGKVAVISGASRGFGQAIAIRFVEEGARVVCLSRGGCDDTLKLISEIEGVPAVEEVAIR